MSWVFFAVAGGGKNLAAPCKSPKIQTSHKGWPKKLKNRIWILDALDAVSAILESGPGA